MSEKGVGPTRRALLEKTAVLFGGITLASVARTGSVTTGARVWSANPASGYLSVIPGEAAFTVSMVNALCPADHLTPNGEDCGLATAMDLRLAGDFGRNEQSVLPPLTQEQFFKAGIAAANTACLERFGARFDQLSAPDACTFLRVIAGGRVTSPVLPLAWWLHETVNPLLVQASFTGPIYESYGNRVFWKLFGHTGAPALRSDSGFNQATA